MVDSVKCFGACVAFFFACSCDAYGQRRSGGPYPRLSQIVEGKIAIKDGKPQVVLMLESFRVSNIETKSDQQSYRIEQVKNEAGEMVEQRTMLGDPVQRTERRVEVKPAGIKPKVIDFQDIKFFDLDLNELTIDQASGRLQQLGPVFLIDRGANVSAFPPAQQKALNQNCLILWSKKDIRQDRRDMDRFMNPFGGDAMGDEDPFGDPPPLEDKDPPAQASDLDDLFGHKIPVEPRADRFSKLRKKCRGSLRRSNAQKYDGLRGSPRQTELPSFNKVIRTGVEPSIV